MPSGGHNAKPLEVHQFEGTYRKHRHNERGPKGGGEPLRKPELGPEASRLWDRITTLRAEWLCRTDTESLQSLCECWELSRRCLKKLDRDVLDRDARIAFKDFMQLFNGLAQKFGLSPSDRARLGISADPKAGVRRREHDELEQLLSE